MFNVSNRDIIPRREIIQNLKKYGSVIIYEDPSMKIQNPILNFGQTHGRMHGHRDKPKAICPFNLSKVAGIKMTKHLERFSKRLIDNYT